MNYYCPVTAITARTLRERGIQPTAQRLAVLNAVFIKPHITADAATEMAASEIGTISRQAVYDALSVLVQNGLVRRIQPAGSAARYEVRVNDNHHHLVCRVCARVVDVDCAVGEVPCLEASDNHGFEIDEAEIAYWGRCPECMLKDVSARQNDPSKELHKRTRSSTKSLL